MEPDEMEAIVRRLENRLRVSWRAMIRGVKDSNSLRDIERRIVSGDLGNLISSGDLAAQHFATEVQAGFVHAGQKVARVVASTSQRAAVFRFDFTDAEAVAWMRAQVANLVNPLAAEQNAVAMRVLQLGRGRGASNREIAEEIRNSMGLNVAQVEQVARYRLVLQRGDYRTALSYQNADGRYDAALRRLAVEGAFLGPERIDAMVERYRDSWGRTRANTVALTTAQRATNAGVSEALDQAVEQGYTTGVRRVWHTRGDHRVRDSHSFMSGQERPMNRAFRSGDGNLLMYPGDSSAPPEDVVNCRCVVELRLARPRSMA